MTALAGRLNRLREEWQTNPRLRLGAWVILGILVFWIVAGLSDLKASAAAAYGDETARLAKIQALSGQTVWLQRAEQAKRLREVLETEIPAARTAGLAQAAFQTQLAQLTASVGGSVRVQVSPANSDTKAEGIWRVPASIDGELSLAQIQQIVYGLETQPNLITIEALSITNRDKVRFTATVQAYYRLPGSAIAHAP